MSLGLSPVDGGAGDHGGQDGGHEGVVDLSEDPARLLHAALQEGLGAGVQVALDEERLHGRPQQVRTVAVPLQEQGTKRPDQGRESSACSQDLTRLSETCSS